MTQNEILLIKCPICKYALSISKEDFNGGMDGRYYDWVIRCDNCGLLKYYTAADNFYGREYSATQQDAIIKFNKYVSHYTRTKEDATPEE